MNFFKKVSLFLLTGALLISSNIASPVSATTTDGIEHNTEGKIVKSYLVKNGEIVKELSTDEVEREMNEYYKEKSILDSQKNVLRQREITLKSSDIDKEKLDTTKSIDPWTLYYESGSRRQVEYGKSVRLTQGFYNQGTAPFTFTITGSNTVNASFNATFSDIEKSAIKSGASVSVGISASKSVSVSYAVPPNKTAWIVIYPLMDNSWGTVKTTLGSHLLSSSWVDT